MSYLDYEGLQVLKEEMDNAFSGIIVSSASGAIASFPDGSGGAVKSLVAQIEPKQSGSGDPSPTNVRPISGWTGAEGKRTGINVWDEEWENGYYNRETGAKDGNGNTTYFRSKNYIPCAPNTSYYFKAPSVHASNATYYAVLFYDADKSYISAMNSGIGNTARTTPQNAQFMTLYIEVGTSGATYQNDISVNYPSTATEYNAYTAETISVTFPSAAGTVYGGTLDVTNGVLTVDRANIASYNGESLPGEWISDRDVYVPGTNPTVGAQVVYELATPQTYQLTPQEVTTLLGANNIWFDVGSTTVEYPADTKLYIDSKLDSAVAELQALILDS